MVWKIKDRTGRVEVDEEFIKILKVYFDFYELSDKKFNPIIGNIISDMGYDKDYTLKPKENIRPIPDLIKIVSIINDSEISIRESVLFNLGGVGKGYFVDKVADFLTHHNSLYIITQYYYFSFYFLK